MSKTTSFIRLYFPRNSRQLSTTSSRRSTTSPQRHGPAAATPLAAAQAQALKPFNDIPGPIALPMLRHSAYVLPRIGNFHHTVGLGLLEGLRDKYGDLVRLAKATRKRSVLYVFNPEMMRQVYESGLTEPPRWDRSPLSQHRKNHSEQCHLHGDELKAVWAGIRTLLLDGTLIKNFEKVFDNIASDATKRLGDLRHADNALNEEIETEIYRWALEIVGVMIFGIRLGCLEGPVNLHPDNNGNTEKTSIDDIIDQCSLSKRRLDDLTPAEQLVQATRDIASSNYLMRSEATLKPESQTFCRAVEAFERHLKITEHFLQQALRVLNSDPKPEQVLLDQLCLLDKKMLPLAADVLLAGVDPLAQTALSMFYHLSLHPAQQQRAHDEVHWAAASIDEGAGCPELPYVAACAKEAMRMAPVTGGVIRRCKEGLVVDGFEIPAGVDIVLAHGVTSKTEKQWGRANSFIPERWCSDDWKPLKACRAHPLASLPFGENCPASGIVGSMLSALTTRVLDKYRLEWHGQLPNIVTTGVNRLQPPFYFVLQNAA